MVDTRVLIKAAKVITLALGIVILGVGLHSHFQSAWAESVKIWASDGYTFDMKPYKLCPVKGLFTQIRDSKCPPISMEHYFVSVIIISFFLSIAIFAVGFVPSMQTDLLKYVDLGYHVIFANLLFVAAIVYMISAVQVDKLVFGNLFDQKETGLNYRKTEKIISGVLTICQSLLFGTIAVLIGKS